MAEEDEDPNEVLREGLLRARVGVGGSASETSSRSELMCFRVEGGVNTPRSCSWRCLVPPFVGVMGAAWNRGGDDYAELEA